MILNFDYNETDNYLDSCIKLFNDKIDNFWNNIIWNTFKSKKYENIKNKTIQDILSKYKNLEKELTFNKVKFNIDLDNNIFIDDNKKKIQKKINIYKKNNLPILKIHSDCFENFHKIIYDYLEEKNKFGNYTIKESFKLDQDIKFDKKSEIILNDEIINECLNIFKNKYSINSFDKNNLSNTINILEKNILKIKDYLINFINIILNNEFSIHILLIDGENILKSFIIQNFLLQNIGKEKFEKYFHTWNEGYLNDSNMIYNSDINSISLSEYSSKIKYIEPFTSLNMSCKKKIKLIKIIIKKLIDKYSVINIISGNDINKSNEEKLEPIINNSSSLSKNQFSTTSTIIDNKYNLPNLFIPINYNDKSDIREQDDHLIIFIYILLKKFNLKPIIISNDKFKWFEDLQFLEIKNFKLMYDFDLNENKIIIDKPYTPPLYKIDSKYNIIPFLNYPILKTNLSIDIISIENIKNIDFIINKKNHLINIIDIEKIYEYLFYSSIYNNSIGSDLKYDRILEYILNYIKFIFIKLNTIEKFLSSNTKENIFKISISNEFNFLSEQEIIDFQLILDNYLKSVEIYIIYKFIIFKLKKYDLIFKLTEIFNNIIEIYYMIDKFIYKIRKLSNSKNKISSLFKKINKIYIYIRKQGYLKKNIF